MDSVLVGTLFVLLLVALSVVFVLKAERDAVDGLVGFLAVLYLIPARLVLPGAGAVGTPATVVGLALFIWWLLSKMLPNSEIADGPQPVRTAMLIYFGWLLVSYAFVIRRQLSVLESNGADREVITAFALFGVGAIAADGIRSRARLERLVSVLVALASVVAAFGLIQFLTPFDPVAYVRIPGLELTREISSETARGVLDRPFSTTLHPIELGVVMAMVFPLALYRLSLASDLRWDKVRRWTSVLLIGAAVPLTVSRSAVLAVSVAVLYYSFGLRGRSRLNLLASAVLAVLVARAVVPGLVGTLSNLFLGSGDDPSIQTRLSDVDVVLSMISTHPLLGWGPGIMSVDEYLLLDNQYYVSTVETGVIGLVALFGLIVIGFVTGRRVARSADEATRRLARALSGSILAAGVAMATFDGLFFRIFSGTLFVLLGITGALWRLERFGDMQTRPSSGGPLIASKLSPDGTNRSESSWT